MMKFMFVLLALGWAVPPGARAEESPRAVVQETANQVVAVLKAPGLTPEQKHHAVADVVDAQFDFDAVSRAVLEPHWGQLTAEQQADSVEELKRQLSLI